MGRKTDVSLEK